MSAVEKERNMSIEHWWKDTDGRTVAYQLLFVHTSVFESNSAQQSQQAKCYLYYPFAKFWELTNEGLVNFIVISHSAHVCVCDKVYHSMACSGICLA